VGVNRFVLGLILDLEQRCHRLLHMLDAHPGHPDVARFRQITANDLTKLQGDIKALGVSDLVRYESLWTYALSEYQQLSESVALIEQYAMPVILNYTDHDHRFCQWLKVLVAETGFPPNLFPVVTATSDQYYWTQPVMGIVGIPIGEQGGILGWPDLTHELAHILLAARPQFLSDFTPITNQYFRKKRDSLRDLNASDVDNQWLSEAQIKWGEKAEGTWRVEIAADLIATYLMGPSYGWQHIRLGMNQGGDPFDPSPGDAITRHPADQARLNAILAMLRLLHLDSDASGIEKQWLELLDLDLRGTPPQGFELYYPPELLQELAEIVFSRCQEERLIAFSTRQGTTGLSVVELIDQAWRQFNCNPAGFPKWEKQAVDQLRDRIRGGSRRDDSLTSPANLIGR
jgi:hypothetical protein